MVFLDALRTLSGYESRQYDIELGCWSLPRKLIVPGATGGDRNLVLVPEKSLVSEYYALGKFGFSNLLGERFTYIPRNGLRIGLEGPSPRVGGAHKTVLRFTVVKWAKKSTEGFPPELLCLSELRGPNGYPLRRTMEIQTATGRTLKE